MPVYGIDYYAGARFGLDPSLVRPDFSVAPFASLALDYQTLWLTWVKPQSSSCTQLQLVRNFYNLPQDETDGEILFNRSVQDTTNHQDSGARNGFNYYSMFGWDNVNSLWIRCTDLIALLPLPWGGGDRLYTLLPGMYQDRDIVLVDPYNPIPLNDPYNPATDPVVQLPPLQRYLNLIGFQLDFIRTELESLMSVNDAQNVSGALIPLLSYQLGMPNEPEIGMQQARQLTANAVHLYKLKGSGHGITSFSAILTSYPTALVHKGYNLLLCRDDSVFETSVGTWQSWPPMGTGFPPTAGENVGLGLTVVPNLLNVPGMTNPLAIIGFEPGPPPYNNTGLAVTVTTTSTVNITTGAIPVLDFLSSTDEPGDATWVVQVFTPGAQRQVELSLWGDFGNKIPVQIGTPQTFTTTLGDWTQIQITAVLDPGQYESPPGANQYYWIYPRIRVLNQPAGATTYFTLLRLWACDPEDVGKNTPVYDYPRDLKLVLEPQAANLLANPLTTFSHGLDGWSAAVDPYDANNLLSPEQASFEAGTLADWTAQNLATTLTNSTAFAHDGAHSMKMTYQSSSLYAWFPILPLTLGPTTVVSYPLAAGTPTGINGIDLTSGGQTDAGGTTYPVSGWFLAETTARPCQIQITWWDKSGNNLGNAVISGNDAVGVFTELLATIQAPVGTVTASAIVSVTGAINGENHYVDDLRIGGLQLTGQLSIRPGEAIHGTASLEVVATDYVGPSVFGGRVDQFTSLAPLGTGWWVDPIGQWFPGQVFGASSGELWFDPSVGWFFLSGNYFAATSLWQGGDWFPQLSPPTTNNLLPFNCAPGEVFDFSVYAKWLTAISPVDTTMLLGFRWYFPDRTFVDSLGPVALTDYLTRFHFSAQAPFQPVTGVPANKFFVLCRFPYAQPSDSFLLNSAMLSYGSQMPPYMDATLFPGSPDYVLDPQGASYYYRRRTPRTARLRAELYRWIPMGATYTMLFESAVDLPPVDPTTW